MALRCVWALKPRRRGSKRCCMRCARHVECIPRYSHLCRVRADGHAPKFQWTLRSRAERAGPGSPVGPSLFVRESQSQPAQGASLRRERAVGLCETSREGHLRVAAGGRSQSLFTTGRAQSVDRKSTRLNSSHSQISYAVFCLKKKKIIILSRITCSIQLMSCTSH